MSNLLLYDVSQGIVSLLTGVVGIAAGYGLRGMVGRWQSEAIEKRAQASLVEAEAEVKNKLKEADILARAEVVKAREEFEKSTKSKRKELQDVEDRLTVREENLDKKLVLLDKKDQLVNQKQDAVQAKAAELTTRRAETDKLMADAQVRLQRLAGMTSDEARREILQRIENEARGEASGLVRRLQEEARETSEREATKIVAQAVQRYAASHAGEMMTCTVQLAGDEIKGRIIGREGRNIRALETATGVTMLVDDTPEAVVISGFDPIRREIARQALEQLVADGRIHPARIEEVVAKVQENMEETIRLAGETAAYDAKVVGAPVELLQKLGRLKFRTSYAQNVLQHSLEVAHLMSVMAGELGLDPALARRAGLFHDIGKAMDHEVEGGHATIGADFLKRLGEDPVVVNAAAAHHQDVEAATPYAVLCSAADAISGSRPGARMETTNVYVQRLEKLEAIANAFEGVRKTFAIQAGREVRVVVDPVQLDDNAAMLLARDISKKIEADLQYPGQIRVVVIRETRCVEYAK
jgi:ribonuclease Y